MELTVFAPAVPKRKTTGKCKVTVTYAYVTPIKVENEILDDTIGGANRVDAIPEGRGE